MQDKPVFQKRLVLRGKQLDTYTFSRAYWLLLWQQALEYVKYLIVYHEALTEFMFSKVGTASRFKL